MLQAKHSSATLFVVVGTQRLEYGIRAGNQWLKEGLGDISIEFLRGVGDPIAAVADAIAQMSLAVRHWHHSQSGDPKLVINDIRVVVADTWLAMTSVPWSSALKHATTSDPFAKAQLIQAGFDITASDKILIDDAAFGLPRLVIGYPATLLAALSKFASSVGAGVEERVGKTTPAKITSVLPLSVVAWTCARELREHSTVIGVLDEGLSLIVQGGATLTDVTARAIDSSAGSAASAQFLGAHWRRLQLRYLQLAQVKQLPVLNLTAPVNASFAAENLSQIELPPQTNGLLVSPRLHLAALSIANKQPLDVVQSRASMTPLQVCIASFAIALTCWLAIYVWHTGREREALTEELASAKSVKQSKPQATAWSKDEIAKVRAVNSAIRQLNLPISALLHALQPPRDIRVAILGVEVAEVSLASTNQTAGVKIVAEARTGAEMARYVAFVAESKPFAGAYLTRHEIVEAAPERPYRFMVEATWQE